MYGRACLQIGYVIHSHHPATPLLASARVEIFFFSVAIYSTRSVPCRRQNTQTASSRLCVRSCDVVVVERGSRPSKGSDRRRCRCPLPTLPRILFLSLRSTS